MTTKGLEMNDFTKKELIEINKVLERDSWELFTDLQSKIQSMIDNYCEHKIVCDHNHRPLCMHCDKEF